MSLARQDRESAASGIVRAASSVGRFIGGNWKPSPRIHKNLMILSQDYALISLEKYIYFMILGQKKILLLTTSFITDTMKTINGLKLLNLNNPTIPRKTISLIGGLIVLKITKASLG